MKDDFDDKPKNTRYEPSSKEVEDMRKALQPFKQKMVGKRLASPFEQYLVWLKVIRINEHGQVICRDPVGYERLSKIDAKLELQEYYGDEALFQQFPEERKILAEKVAAMRKKMTL